MRGATTWLALACGAARAADVVETCAWNVHEATCAGPRAYAAQQARIPELMRANPGLEVSEAVKEPTLFYSGDTTIGLLEARSSEILAYRYIIHECTFLGEPTAELDEYARKRGHTHYAQLHRYICAAPNTVWVLVHWSVRYSRQDVEDFFEDKYGGVPRNVVLWIK